MSSGDVERLLALVLVGEPDDCWLWAGSTHNGYGQFWMGNKHHRAHRLVYELKVGPIPDGRHVLHSCGNSVCVNPAHLRPGDDSQNQLDSVSHGSHPWARKTHCPKGHPYSGENLIGYGEKKYRECRTCRHEQRARRWQREKAARDYPVRGGG